MTLNEHEGPVPFKATELNEKLASAGTAAADPAAAALPHGKATVLPASGYLTAEWVKRHYAISNSTLYKWIGDKRFPAPVRIGPRAVRWRAEDLAAFEATLKAGE